MIKDYHLNGLHHILKDIYNEMYIKTFIIFYKRNMFNYIWYYVRVVFNYIINCINIYLDNMEPIFIL